MTMSPEAAEPNGEKTKSMILWEMHPYSNGEVTFIFNFLYAA